MYQGPAQYGSISVHRGSVLAVALIALLAIAVICALWWFRPQPIVKAHVSAPMPIVDVQAAMPQSYQVQVRSQGLVAPRREIKLVAQVSGSVVDTAENFDDGAFFGPEQTLVTLDERDYRYALTIADAKLADARRELALEQGQGRQAKRQWRDLGSEAANELFLRMPQLQAAEANLRAAQAERDRALLNVERTRLRVPFAGRIASTHIALGEYVSAGSVVAIVYDSAALEVRLPVSNAQLALLDMPLDGNSPLSLPLRLYGTLGGRQYQWSASLKKIDSQVDTATRFYHLIAEVAGPFDRQRHDHPLLTGLFVEAVIPGRVFKQAVPVPQKALLNNKQVFMVAAENKLVLRAVDIIAVEGDIAWLNGDFQLGEQIVISDPRVLSESVQVQVKSPP
ncbi:MAG: efflux RND transporter periplasmic adaptor subunit [Cellvibrionaceae bacterium]|nr:efflux RND transporter periplasmic adaptor subunit [Cellvibrionaceae bacterium]